MIQKIDMYSVLKTIKAVILMEDSSTDLVECYECAEKEIVRNRYNFRLIPCKRTNSTKPNRYG